MNLLPKEEKDLIKGTFKSRSIGAALYVVSFVLISGIVMLMPVYFVSTGYMQEDSVRGGSGSKIIDSGEVEELLKIPEEINAKASFVQSFVSMPSSVETINKIFSFLPEGVFLKSVNFDRNQTFKGKTGTVVLVSGNALTRDSLLKFSNSLKESKEFSQVEIPVSSFAKDKNLSFSITVLIEK
jgi:hypothetical protein